DYHVILLLKENDPITNAKKMWVYDLDTTLPFPCDIETYAYEALIPVAVPQYQRKYRVVPSEVFLKVFASDRSHMKKPDGTWISDPPNYSPISSPESAMNLHEFLSMTENLKSEEYGEVLDEKDFLKFCNVQRSDRV
ncbi:10916_t:CDS:2, partial [Acaulospora morrowiae]